MPADNTFTQAMPQTCPYRDRLTRQLGDEYKGAEKYRLGEDDKREKHWKMIGSISQWQAVGGLIL